jgi:hypothetical protein
MDSGRAVIIYSTCDGQVKFSEAPNSHNCAYNMCLVTAVRRKCKCIFTDNARCIAEYRPEHGENGNMTTVQWNVRKACCEVLQSVIKTQYVNSAIES